MQIDLPPHVQIKLAAMAAEAGFESVERFAAEQLQHLADDSDLTENVAAVAASINDFKRGERGTLAGENSKRLRKALGGE